jgi:hypothetical protein
MVVGDAVEHDARRDHRPYLLVFSVSEGVRLVVNAAPGIHPEDASGRIGTPLDPGRRVDVALDDGHQHLLHAVECRVHPTRAGAVEVIHVVDDELVAPRPAGRLPDVGVVAEKAVRDARLLGDANDTLVVIADAHGCFGECPVPFGDAHFGKLVLILRPRSVRVFRVERDRVPVHHVADEHNVVALVRVPQIPTERQVAGMADGLVDVADDQDAGH